MYSSIGKLDAGVEFVRVNKRKGQILINYQLQKCSLEGVGSVDVAVCSLGSGSRGSDNIN